MVKHACTHPSRFQAMVAPESIGSTWWKLSSSSWAAREKSSEFGESVRLVCVCVVALVQILVREILLDDDERDEFFVK